MGQHADGTRYGKHPFTQMALQVQLFQTHAFWLLCVGWFPLELAYVNSSKKALENVHKDPKPTQLLRLVCRVRASNLHLFTCKEERVARYTEKRSVLCGLRKRGVFFFLNLADWYGAWTKH
jgi:hypothetical protein